MDTSTAHAVIRFGLGPRRNETPPGDVRGWLEAQLGAPAPDARPPGGADVGDAIAALVQDHQTPPPPGEPRCTHLIFRAESEALLDRALATDAPFRERLVQFWCNHFTVSVRRGPVAALIGAYVRDAIRQHVTGQFGDMLLAVVRHPAMLMYLDNAVPSGPNSPAGARQHRGLNENLARECLELHTLGPASGYSQTDVTEFAKILTGWSIERQLPPLGFRFRPALHEPGTKTLLGRTFEEGEQGGRDALGWLAQHPATHRHLAAKLVQHFAADEPPPDAVRRIEAVLRDTRGNLGAAASALIRIEAAWHPLAKLRTPQDFVLAALRAADLPDAGRPDTARIMAGLGQPIFNAPFPSGWSDLAADWSGPQELLRRIDWAYGFAGRDQLADPMELAESSLGPLLSAATGAEIRHAGSRREALTLLFASPEFQRR